MQFFTVPRRLVDDFSRHCDSSYQCEVATDARWQSRVEAIEVETQTLNDIPDSVVLVEYSRWHRARLMDGLKESECAKC